MILDEGRVDEGVTKERAGETVKMATRGSECHSVALIPFSSLPFLPDDHSFLTLTYPLCGYIYSVCGYIYSLYGYIYSLYDWLVEIASLASLYQDEDVVY